MTKNEFEKEVRDSITCYRAVYQSSGGHAIGKHSLIFSGGKNSESIAFYGADADDLFRRINHVAELDGQKLASIDNSLVIFMVGYNDTYENPILTVGQVATNRGGVSFYAIGGKAAKALWSDINGGERHV